MHKSKLNVDKSPYLFLSITNELLIGGISKNLSSAYSGETEVSSIT